MNPYETPASSIETVPIARTRRTRRGPALYIVCGGLLGGVGAIASLAMKNPIGLVFIFLGCLAGGFLYRLVSLDWPHDPSVRRRQIIYSVLAVILLPLTIWLATDDEFVRLTYTVIGAVVGGSIACGILISGTRRS